MEKISRLIVLAGILTASLISLNGCGDTSKMHEAEARENLKEAGTDLGKAAIAANEEAKAKAAADWQQFKNESDSTIADLDRQIVMLKEKIANGDKNLKEKLTGDLNKAEVKLNGQKEKLKQKSLEFEAGLMKFDESVVTNTDSFKKEFQHDMVELGSAMKNLLRTT